MKRATPEIVMANGPIAQWWKTATITLAAVLISICTTAGVLGVSRIPVLETRFEEHCEHTARRMDKIVAKFPKASPLPVYLFVAGDERIIDSEKTMRFIRELHWPRTRITTYAEARHSLEFEGDPEVYFSDLVRFIDQAN